MSPGVPQRDNSCRGLLTVIGLLFFLTLIMTPTRKVPTETSWMEPSLCSVGDPNFNNLVSYISTVAADGADVEFDAGERRLQEAEMPGFGCPADITGSTPQDFVLPISLSWPAYGANVSFAVFRGEADSVELSFTLKDANGKLLLREDGLKLGPPPTPRSEWTHPPPPPPRPPPPPTYQVPQPAAVQQSPGPGRQLLFSTAGLAQRGEAVRNDELNAPASRPGRPKRHLLKGGSYSYRSYGVGGSSRSRAAVAQPWGTSVVRPTPYGFTANRVVMYSAVVMIMHNHHGYGRYYADDDGCYTSYGCPVRVAEPLDRDILGSHFELTREVAFPLTLTFSTIDVSRAADGYPSVFFNFYSEGADPPPPPILAVLPYIAVPAILAFLCSWCRPLLTRRLPRQRAGDTFVGSSDQQQVVVGRPVVSAVAASVARPQRSGAFQL